MNTKEEAIKWSFQGRYALAQEGIAINAMSFLGCSKEQAERLANAFAADYGNWQKEAKDKGLKLKYGSVDKNQHFTIVQIDEMETNIRNPSPALVICRTLYVIDKAFMLKNGIIRNACTIQLVSRLHDWLFQVEEVEGVNAVAIGEEVKA